MPHRSSPLRRRGRRCRSPLRMPPSSQPSGAAPSIRRRHPRQPRSVPTSSSAASRGFRLRANLLMSKSSCCQGAAIDALAEAKVWRPIWLKSREGGSAHQNFELTRWHANYGSHFSAPRLPPLLPCLMAAQPRELGSNCRKGHREEV
ncbi:uncharacterized protein LOC104581801 isoform X1 [Brachypodium distachyon]|nr:uncharacterized protein LOC104581801 isoform X1 [Brachypodium distachyon]|eukprot:XP_010228746.1 uncharacterized protein LOC104581801 isoform X1 [Brachypodium distachyon]